MSTWSKYLTLALFLGAAPAAESGTEASRASATNEDQLRAAFVYQFTRFVQWSKSNFDPAHAKFFVIRVHDDDRLVDYLREMATTRKVQGLPIAIQNREDQSVRPCPQILILGSKDRAKLALQMERYKGCGTLTVASIGRSVLEEVAIRFASEGGRLHFHIHRTLATREGLGLSSHLLRLARSIE